MSLKGAARGILFLTLGVAANAGTLSAAALHTQTFAAVKAALSPPNDAGFDAPVWQSAVTLTGFYDFSLREPARHKTIARILYDDRNVYVGVSAEQFGVPITATQTVDNAGIGHDDRIIVQLDTSGKGQRHYEFSASAKGVRNEYSAENARYAPQWSTLARLRPTGGYNLLMVIPISDMRTSGAAVQSWRFNVIRVMAATNEVYTWAFEPTQSSLDSELNWPVLGGLRISARAARPRPQADLYTLASAGSDHDLFQGVLGSFNTHKARPIGLDLTYPVTNSLAFVGTLDPDFSNVEVDQTTIAPQEFQRTLSEYRPFFTQGAKYINTIASPDVNGIGGSLFYTPSIGIFDRGEKLEGTISNSAIGLLDVSGSGFHDDAFGYTFEGAGNNFAAQLQGVAANHAGLRDNVLGYSISGSVKSNIQSYTLTALADRFLDRSGAVHDADVAAGASVMLKNLLSVSFNSSTTELRSYQTAFPVYAGPRVTRFNQDAITLGYRDGTPSPLDLSYSAGLFGANAAGDQLFVQQLASSLTRALGTRYTLTLDFDGTVERIPGARAASNDTSPALDSQWLRRISLTRAFDKDTSFAIGLRSINGIGGFAVPGTNIALSFHRRFRNEDQLYIDYGTPAANQTLHRIIAKYVFHAGGETGKKRSNRKSAWMALFRLAWPGNAPAEPLVLSVALVVAARKRQSLFRYGLEELVVRARLRHLVEDELGDVAAVEHARRAAEHPDLAHLDFAEQQLSVARARALDVDGREDTRFRE